MKYKTFFFLLATLLLLGILPFIIFFFSNDVIPFGNHGPWRYSLENYSIFFPIIGYFLCLVIYQIITQKLKTEQFVLLLLLSLGILILQGRFLFWLVD